MIIHIPTWRAEMKTIQMTIDEPLLTEVDRTVRKLHINRSAFVRRALRLALQQYKLTELEEKHAAGYARHPVEAGEFDVWEGEQAWGEA